MQEKMLKYTDPGTQYCHDVLSGKILACKKIKQSCQRHLTDLKRIGDSDFPYYYDQDIARGIVNFVRIIPDVSTHRLMEPQPFQCFILDMLYAWRKNNGGKRFRRALISMARTNGKTQLDSWLMLYDFYFGLPKWNRTLCCAANSNDQADKLLKYVKSTISALENLADDTSNKLHSIYQQFRANKKQAGNEDGVERLWNKVRWNKYAVEIQRIAPGVNNIDSNHYTLAVVDEGHQLKDDTFVSKISSGQVSLAEALLIESSTAGLDPKVPLHQEYELMADVLNGKRHNDRQFIAIFEQDNQGEIANPKSWEKSNPLLCYKPFRATRLDGLIAERDDKILKGEKSDFLVKNMNLWQNAKVNSYINISTWQSNIIDQFNFNKRKVYIGYDASMTSDDTSFGFDFPYIDENGQHKFFIFQHSFIPTQKAGSIEAKEKIDGIPYRKYEDHGYCEVTRNQFGLISDDQVYNWLLNFVKKHQLQVLAFCYDSYHADKIVNALQNNTDWNIVPVRQGTISLNAPTKDLRDRLIEHSVTHFDDKIMEAGFSNAILKIDNNGIKVDKDTGSQKIDCVDAVMDAHFQAMYYFENYDENDPNNMSIDDLNRYFQSDDFGF